MPLYEYTCRTCKSSFDLIRSVAERDVPGSCRHCGASGIQRRYAAAPAPAVPIADETAGAPAASGRADLSWRKAATVLVILLACVIAAVKLKIWVSWADWAHGANAPVIRVGGWPLLYWARLGKILEFASGLTIILDLMGEERVDRWHTYARTTFARTVGYSKTLPAATFKPWKARAASLAWVALPICGAVSGLAVYYFQRDIVHSSITFSVVAAVLIGVCTVGFAFGLTAGGIVYSLALVGVYGVDYFHYKFHVEHAPSWVQMLVSSGPDSNGPALLPVAILTAAVIYVLAMVLLFAIELTARFAVTGVLLGAATFLRWALHEEARPLRWVALAFFLVGFHFDLLSS